VKYFCAVLLSPSEIIRSTKPVTHHLVLLQVFATCTTSVGHINIIFSYNLCLKIKVKDFVSDVTPCVLDHGVSPQNFVKLTATILTATQLKRT